MRSKIIGRQAYCPIRVAVTRYFNAQYWRANA